MYILVFNQCMDSRTPSVLIHTMYIPDSILAYTRKNMHNWNSCFTMWGDKINSLQPMQCLYVSYCIIQSVHFYLLLKNLFYVCQTTGTIKFLHHPNISTSKPPQLGKLGSSTELRKVCVYSCDHTVNMMINKLHFIILVVNQCYSQPKKPNILMIVVDDLGWADVPWHDHTIYAPRLVTFVALSYCYLLISFMQDKGVSRNRGNFEQQLCAASLHPITCSSVDRDVSLSSWKTAQGSQTSSCWRNTNWVQVVTRNVEEVWLLNTYDWKVACGVLCMGVHSNKERVWQFLRDLSWCVGPFQSCSGQVWWIWLS